VGVNPLFIAGLTPDVLPLQGVMGGALFGAKAGHERNHKRSKSNGTT